MHCMPSLGSSRTQAINLLVFGNPQTREYHKLRPHYTTVDDPELKRLLSSIGNQDCSILVVDDHKLKSVALSKVRIHIPRRRLFLIVEKKRFQPR
jgi:hypothetical protein